MPTSRRRVVLTIRLNDAELAQVDALAAADGRARSEMIRRLLSEALLARAQQAEVYVDTTSPS